jgi:predicted amidophosphoribosyltransferase
MRAIADLVAPLRCAGCGNDAHDDLCESCALRVRVLTPPWCDRCGTPQSGATNTCPACAHLGGFTRARSLVEFAEPSRRLTLQLKRRGRGELASVIGELLGLLAQREGMVTPSTTVTWVPGGRTSRMHGFDHAAQIARAIAASQHRPAEALLKRANDGPRQADVPLEKRRENVAGRFVVPRAKNHVLLVDDVYTTGSTAEACAAALRAAGAGAVDVITWARTRRRWPRIRG